MTDNQERAVVKRELNQLMDAFFRAVSLALPTHEQAAESELLA
jgi:hypothetical protein